MGGLFYVYECLVCVCLCVSGTCGGQKRGPSPLELLGRQVLLTTEDSLCNFFYSSVSFSQR